MSSEAITIDSERALELLRQVVQGKEDYVYQNPEYTPAYQCAYAHGDQPGCVVGHVFLLAGLTINEVRYLDGNGDVIDLYDNEELRWRVCMDGRAARLLRQAQEAQDGGATWGEALQAAEHATSGG